MKIDHPQCYLSPRVVSALANAGLYDTRQLVGRPMAEMQALPGVGARAIRELVQVITDHDQLLEVRDGAIVFQSGLRLDEPLSSDTAVLQAEVQHLRTVLAAMEGHAARPPVQQGPVQHHPGDDADASVPQPN